MDNKIDNIHPENPEKLNNIKLSDPDNKAAGPKAVLKSVKHVLNAMSIGRGLKALNNLNQFDGYDCPGCAWPDPDDERSRLGEYCENGAKAVAEEATSKALYADFFEKHSIQEMSEWDDYTIGKKGRLAQPMYLPKDATHYESISWEKAFQKIAQHLNTLGSPDEAIFYTSGRTSNEAAFLYQLFVKAYGTNNMPDCSNMCHESSGVALDESLGIGKGSVTLEDFYEAEVIFIIGQNPGTNHPRMLSALEKATKNGAFIISVNPLLETGMKAFANPQSLMGLLGKGKAISHDHLPVRINGDMALFQAINQLLIHHYEDRLDHDFIKTHTHGFEDYKNHLNQLDFNHLVDQSGIPALKIQEIAELLSQKNKIITCWAMGLTQHKNAVNTIKEVVNTLLLKGSIGKPGAGTCPVRGHSNVQGDRTVGVYEKPWPWLLDNIENHYNFSPPRENGYDTVESIQAMYEGKAKVFFAMGGNFLSATPDTLYTAKALQNCQLTVHVSTKLNRSHLVHGKEALILPTLGRSDQDIQNGKAQFVSCENSMGIVQRSQGVLTPVSDQLLSEVAIVCRLAQATLGAQKIVDWSKYEKNYDLIRDDIEKIIPGFERYNERVRLDGGFYLPNSARENQYPTSTQKANFSIENTFEIPLKDHEFIMMTIRSHDQYNTTIYGMNDRYRGIKNERRVVLMNEADMKARGFKKLDVVNLINSDDGIERIAKTFLVIPYEIPTKCIATYFPEANVLVPINAVAKKSNTPVSKSVVVRIEPQK